MPKHASASLAVLDLVMASPAQPAARRSPRRPCLLSARSDGQPLPRSDQKGKLFLKYIYRGHAVGFRVCVLTTDLGSRFYKLIACLIRLTHHSSHMRAARAPCLAR